MAGLSTESGLTDVVGETEQRTREFRFEQRHFDYIAEILYRLAGIHLASHKVEMMYARLARRLRKLGMPDFDAYCALLASRDGIDELGFLVNALTTNLTSFFREPHHFQHLSQVTLAQVRERNRGPGKPRLRIWSAGCSSGQEPYTIAMVLQTALDDIRRWDARILATDIDTHMVETAKEGLYSLDSADGLPAAMKDRFTRIVRGDQDTRLGMSHDIKSLIMFKPLNLLEPWPMRGPFDAIFCRNVLIYFDRMGRKQIVDRFADLLVPNGYLYLGHSESLFGISQRFQQSGPTIYRRLA